jgi:hypothetical protein
MDLVHGWVGNVKSLFSFVFVSMSGFRVGVFWFLELIEVVVCRYQVGGS